MDNTNQFRTQGYNEGENNDNERRSVRPSPSLPVFPTEDTPLLPPQERRRPRNKVLRHSNSFSTKEGIHPYTRENKPKRRPFHPSPARRISAEQDSHLYARFRYYSRLRAPAESSDHALVIPDHVVPTSLFLFYLPGQLRDSDGKQGSFVTIASIWNTMMGTSLLTMPWAFGEAGFLAGIIIMLIQGVICLYTACKLVNLQKNMGLEGEMHELGYLFRTLWPGSLGKVIEGTSVTFSIVTLLGALVVYWVLMSNFLYNTGEAIYHVVWGSADNATNVGVLCPANNSEATTSITVNGGDDPFHHFWQQDLSVPIYLLIPFLFLVNMKNTAIFAYFNSFGAISVMAIFLFVMVKAYYWGFNFTLIDPDSPLWVPLLKRNFMALSGTLSLAYFIHNCVVTLLKTNKNPENNVRDLSIAYLLVALTYIPVGVIFYLTFPAPKFCVAQNLLDNFPPHNVTLAIARAFLLFQMITVYPLLTFFLRSQLLSYIFGPAFQHTRKITFSINALVLLLSVCVAVFYPRIGFILRWVGAISGMAFIFFLPQLTDMQNLYNKGQLSWLRVIGSSIIMALGVANFAAQFFAL